MSRFLTRERPKKVLIEGAVCWKIHLTQGQYALIDVADEALVLPYRWYARKSSAGHFYAERKDAESQRVVRMHRVVMRLPDRDSREVDHRERARTLDNRRSNLRIVTHRQNAWNKKILANSVSGLKGSFLSRRSGKYWSRIRVNGREIHLGTFLTAKDAHVAYCRAAQEHFGQLARFK